jgi:hypothetical protein
MTDLVQRLRQESSVLISAYETHTRDLVREAADEIERLTKKAQGLALDCLALNDECSASMVTIAEERSRADRAEAEVERLRAALARCEAINVGIGPHPQRTGDEK